MKTGIRTPSIEKKIKAKTTGKVKRKLKRTVNPLYGQKGMGYVKNPEKAIKNSIYHKTTIDAYSLIQPTETKNVISKRNNNTTTTNAVTGLLLAIFLGWAGGYRFYKKQCLLGFFYFFTVGICGIGWIIDLFCAYGAFYDERHAPSYLKLDKSKYMDPKPEFFPNYANEQFYIIYDFETTGLDPHKCEIIEIGAIKIADGKVVDTFQSLVKPYNPIPTEATKINHISNDMVKNAPPAEKIIPSFLDFIGNSPLVGYNIINFDHIILRRYAVSICNKLLENYVTDIYLISRNMICLPKYSLSDVASYFEIKESNAHRAMDDCETTLKCFKCIQEYK